MTLRSPQGDRYNGLVKSEVPSQDRLLDELDSGVDVSQIDERLALSPTERLERMRQFLVFLDGMKTGDADAPRRSSRAPVPSGPDK